MRGSGAAVLLLNHYRDGSHQSCHQQEHRQHHQESHHLIFMVFHKGDHIQRVAERGDHTHPQQSAQPVEELEAAV